MKITMIQKFKNILLFVLCVTAGAFYAQAQEDALELKGVILSDATATPLPGISVSVAGMNSAMSTDDGTFTLKVPSYNVELTVSGPLYESKRVALRGRQEVTIRLQEQGFQHSVYKEVLTPLGATNNAHLTSSAVFLNSDKSTSVNAMPEQLLQGEVSGLNTLFRSGMDGAGANMFLRGFNSIYASNQPLLVIDGMILENQQFGTSLIEGYVSTPMGAIDVKDIDQITVLKDATAIYGVKGANGAILIQTKHTSDLTTRISVQALAGLELQPQKLPLLNASDNKKYMVDMVQSTGAFTPGMIQQLAFVNQEKPQPEKWGYSGNRSYYRYNKNTDWQDEIFTEAFKQQYTLGVSGGDEVAVYGLSLGFLQKDGIVEGTDYNRFNARINSDIKFSQRIGLTTNMSFVYGKKNLRNESTADPSNPLYSALVKSPFTAAHVYNEENLRSPNFEDVDMFGASNPLVIQQNLNMENSFYRFMGNADLHIKLLENLKLSSNFGIDFSKERERIFYPIGGIPYDDMALAQVVNKQQHRVERLFTIFDETRLAYNLKIDYDHKLDLTAGFRFMNSSAEDDYGKGYNSSSNYFVSIGKGSNKLFQTGGAQATWKWFSMFANASYNLKNKYFVDATLSFDASSRYGSEISKFQAYPSIGAAWLVSSEEFMKGVDFIDLLKLRVNYTVAGNDGIGNYTARRYYVPQNFLGNYGLVRGNLVNENIKPERNSKMNVGVDLSLFNERLSLAADFYTNKVKDLLLYTDARSFTGFNEYVDNGGEMKNTGFDIALNARLVNTKAVKWDLGVSISKYKNEVTALKSGAFNTEIADATIRTQVGSPLGLFYGYKTNGVYATTAEAEQDQLYTMIGTVKTPFTAGDVRFVNANNADNVIDEKDMQVIGDPTPDFFGGITTELRWNRLSLSGKFIYSVGNDVYNYTRKSLESMSGFQNQTQAVLNRWKVEGQQTSMPKAMYGDPMGNSRFSDRWIEDGSYLKLKNLTIAYDVPIRSSFFTDLTVYAAGENLFTATKYKGYDPEITSISTSPLYYGIDAFTIPTSRTFYIGVKIGL